MYGQKSIFDVVFIGGGISSAATLFEMISQLSELEVSGPIRCAVVEPQGILGGGVAYGGLCGVDALLISSVDEFLPESWRVRFVAWLQLNYEDVVRYVTENSRVFTSPWIDALSSKIKSGDVGDCYLPRVLFGLFFDHILRKSIAGNPQCVAVTHVHSRVKGVSKLNNFDECLYNVVCANGVSLKTKKLVLGLGSLPTKKIPFVGGVNQSKAILINDPYSPSLEKNIDKINSSFRHKRNLNVAIAGGNASALESNFQIQHICGAFFDNVNISVINSNGKLPNSVVRGFSGFEAKHLDTLLEMDGQLSADLILECFLSDLSDANKNQYSISDTLPVFTGKIGFLVSKLDRCEKLKFANYHGHQIGRRQRRCGPMYEDAWNSPNKNCNLSFVQGNVVHCYAQPDGALGVAVETVSNGTQSVSDVDVFINCTGSSQIDDLEDNHFISRLVSSLDLSVTQSGLGLIVDGNFRACENVWVNGPLLSGNVIEDKCVWHVEHCGRILNFASEIAPLLVDRQYH